MFNASSHSMWIGMLLETMNDHHIDAREVGDIARIYVTFLAGIGRRQEGCKPTS